MNAPTKNLRPRYLQLTETLSRAIRNGKHAVGSLLPTESELCERFSVSRFTVRQALRELKEAGLVVPEHGVGTRIARASASERFLLSLGSMSDIQNFVNATRFELVRKKMIEPSEAEIPLPEVANSDNPWLLVELLRFDEKQASLPITLSQIHISPQYAGVSGQVGKSAKPVYALIEEKYGAKIQNVRQEISAVKIPQRIARHLQVKSGSPALRIRRHYLSTKGDVIEVAQNYTISDRFIYSMDISTTE